MSQLEDKIEVISELITLYDDNPEGELYLKSLVNLVQNSSFEFQEKAFKVAYQYYSKRENKSLTNQWFKECLNIQKKNGSEHIYETFEDLGDWFKKNFELDSAIYYYVQAENGFKLKEKNKELVEVLNKQGIIQKDLNNFGEALQKYYLAYDLAKSYKLTNNLASTCINIGVVFKKQDQFEDAMLYYKEAEKLYVSLDDHIGLANAYNNIGNILRINGEYQMALQNYKKAIKHRNLGGSEKTLSYSYNNIALVYKDLGVYDSAIYYLKISEGYKIKLNEEASLSSTYLNFADTYAKINDSVNFLVYYELAEKYSLDYNDYLNVQELKIIASEYSAQKGRFKDAYYSLLEVIEMMDTMSNKEQQVLSQVLKAKYDDKKKVELINELEVSLQVQKDQENELKQDEKRLKIVVGALISVSLVLILVLFIMFRNSVGLKKSNEKLAVLNSELATTKLGAEEKEIMIKEIHHRVKNNLQVVKSLIRLQKESAGESLEMLSDFENRVSSIALVHESLYASVDLSKVDVGAYYEKLINDLIDAYAVGQTIEKIITIDKLTFGIDTLIPLGLLTNEIVSNALKHAFKGMDKGQIYITLNELKDGKYYLEIADNGRGLNKDFLNRNSLGLELIDTLVGQLDGVKELTVNNGTKYVIIFKNQDKS
ncbi:MAG: tetratricopeptide repeat protein [Flavobacteriales bacterium]|nr:tetratricopeptide repeat protein [Flavobacteriales bacterium]